MRQLLKSRSTRRTFGWVGYVALAVAIANNCARAADRPSSVEEDSWSDMSFPGNVSGSFNSATKTLAFSALPSNSLEIGSQFGPSTSGANYGSNGTLGGPFSATLS